MLSIFIMYSTDRAKALSYTISCLQDMEYYDRCQRTLIVDGKIDSIPKGWEHVQVPRVDGKFCWGRMWDAGVGVSRHPMIVYLDSDRLLPKNYLEMVIKKLKDDLFVFTTNHFAMTNELPIDVCKKFLTLRDPLCMLMKDEYLGNMLYEPRFQEPFHGPNKNVMSGSTAFTKKTYLKLGGVDHWYCGHGAYADTDFHLQAALAGCSFVDLGLTELHFPHPKLGENNKALDQSVLQKMGLENLIYYCWKWGLQNSIAEQIAYRCNIPRPAQYVDKRMKLLKATAKGS